MLPFQLECVMISLSSLSLFSSLLFILRYCCSKKQSQELYLKFILIIQLSDTIFALGLILLYFENDSNKLICFIQDFSMVFGGLISVLTRLAITIILYVTCKKNEIFFEKFQIHTFLLVIIVAFVMSLM